MFGFKRRRRELADTFDLILTELSALNRKFDELNFEEKIVKFHNQIADRYFGALTTFIQWNKEVALVSSLSNKIGSKDLDELKESLLQPFYEQKWQATRADQAEQINKVMQTKGEEIRKKKAALEEKLLICQRSNLSTAEIAAQLNLLKELEI